MGQWRIADMSSLVAEEVCVLLGDVEMSFGVKLRKSL